MRRLMRKPMVRDTARRGGSLEGVIDGSIPYSMTTDRETLMPEISTGHHNKHDGPQMCKTAYSRRSTVGAG